MTLRWSETNCVQFDLNYYKLSNWILFFKTSNFAVIQLYLLHNNFNQQPYLRSFSINNHVRNLYYCRPKVFYLGSCFNLVVQQLSKCLGPGTDVWSPFETLHCNSNIHNQNSLITTFLHYVETILSRQRKVNP